MLQAAEVDFVARNEEVQDIFGWGRFPGGMNLAMGAVELQVRREDAPFALELLRTLADESATDEAGGVPDPEDA
jgi:hypothetical protein